MCARGVPVLSAFSPCGFAAIRSFFMFGNKKIICLIAAILICVMCAILFAACDQNADRSEKNITVYVGEKVFEVTTDEAYLDGVLDKLFKEQKLSKYKVGSSALGKFIIEIDELTLRDGQYFSVWHSVDRFELKSVYNAQWASSNPSRATTKTEDGAVFTVTEYMGKTLYYSGVGISSLPLVNGGVYAVLVD